VPTRPGPRLQVSPYGDTGVLAGVQHDDYETRWSTTQGLATAVRDAGPEWLVDLVATYDQLFLTFDPVSGDHEGATALLRRLFDGRRVGAAPQGRTLEVPVLFGGEAGPDLEDVATELDLSPERLVTRLTQSPWRVRFVAGPVGTPFTDRPDWSVSVPRMRVPRVQVPPGSVALSGSQSIVYPVRSPGGWRLVGLTPLRLLASDPATEELVAYRAGDLLRYVAIDRERHERLAEGGARLGADR
jgi:KipI family sensor histidine kinase inhibitor